MTDRIWESLVGKTETRILMVGLDAAGKTTMLFSWKLDEAAITILTIGFNVETVGYKNQCFTMWAEGGQDFHGANTTGERRQTKNSLKC